MNSFSFITSKLGDVDAKTRSIALEVYNVARGNGHNIRFLWGFGGGKEHGSGLALDFMVYNEAAGDFIRNYLWTHRKRLGLRHVIWEQHITSTVVQPGVRRKMADRGSVTENHYDHVHVWFFPGKYASLSETTTVPRPKPSTPAKPRPNPVKKSVRTLYWNKKKQLSGPDVLRWQKGLKRVFPAYAGRLETDRYFGRSTDKVTREFQRRAGLPVDGRVGPKTRAAARKYGIAI